MNPIFIIEGIFRDTPEGFVVTPDDGDDVSIEEILKAREGEEVSLQIHYFPPIPPLPREGGGSCLWPSGLCPHGHKTNMAWMYSQDLSGTLAKQGSDWVVGESPSVLTPMPGHRGRLVIFCGKEVQDPGDVDLESLMSEAGGLLSQFEALQKAMKEKP